MQIVKIILLFKSCERIMQLKIRTIMRYEENIYEKCCITLNFSYMSGEGTDQDTYGFMVYPSLLLIYNSQTRIIYFSFKIKMNYLCM